MPFSEPNSLMEPWLEFKNPIVRQLAFAIASPNLLSTIPNDLEIKNSFELHDHQFWQQHFKNYKTKLFALDRDSTELEDFLSHLKSTRLGLRFEMLIWFWLLDNKYHHYELLEHSLQIIDGPLTVGELDFVLLNTQTNEIEHWEVALKYYLAEEDYSLPFWYGLNREDTLARKLNHFTQKQFQFSEVKNYKIERKFAVIKGQLYLPENIDQAVIPDWLNRHRRLGKMKDIVSLDLNFYQPLARDEWICPKTNSTYESTIWWKNDLYYLK
jgi:uncharacterized protein